MRKQTMDLKTKPTTPMLMIRPEFHLVLSLTVLVFRNTIAEVQLRRTKIRPPPRRQLPRASQA